MLKRINRWLLVFLFISLLTSCTLIDENNDTYTTKEEVASYLRSHGELPSNYITKQEARDLGWIESKGNLWEVTDQKSIGGDRFGNFEGLLPKKEGRIYFEADIDYQGGYRNAKRLVFSSDGLIFYTDDHYESFVEYDKETRTWK